MLVLSNRAPENNAHSPSYIRFAEMMDRRLSIARMGLAEARRHLEAGQSEDADIVLEKIDEDLYLLRRRLIREVETVAPRSSVLYDCASQSN